jgi:hypothetical protein
MPVLQASSLFLFYSIRATILGHGPARIRGWSLPFSGDTDTLRGVLYSSPRCLSPINLAVKIYHLEGSAPSAASRAPSHVPGKPPSCFTTIWSAVNWWPQGGGREG